MTGSEIPREDAEAALQARRELGPEYEEAIVDSFVDRLDTALERRISAEVERRLGSPEVARQQRKAEAERSGQALALGIVSLALSIPLIAVSSETAGAAGLVLVLLMIVIVNVAFNINRLRR